MRRLMTAMCVPDATAAVPLNARLYHRMAAIGPLRADPRSDPLGTKAGTNEEYCALAARAQISNCRPSSTTWSGGIPK